MKETSNFEMYTDENEKVTVTTIPDLDNSKIEVVGITLENDTMIQLKDLSEGLRNYIQEETNKYLEKLIND